LSFLIRSNQTHRKSDFDSYLLAFAVSLMMSCVVKGGLLAGDCVLSQQTKRQEVEHDGVKSSQRRAT